jgi:hypothetical protein
MRQVGIEWSLRTTDDEVRREYERLWNEIGDRPIEAFLDLPRMSDLECRATMDVLAAFWALPMRRTRICSRLRSFT